MRRLSFLRGRSLRFRMTATFVLAVTLLVGTLTVATLFTVRRFLEDQRVRSSTRQTIFAVLFAREFLASSPDVSELVTKLQIRENFDAMVTSRAQWFATSLELTPESAPRELRALVRRGSVGYQIAMLGGERVLVYGVPLPQQEHDLFVFFPMVDIDRTVSLLIRVLTVTGLAVVVVAAAGARKAATRILYPLSAVSNAAQRMAQGLLETRVESVTDDELGQLAMSFNRMAEALHGMVQRERDFVAAVSHELRSPLSALHAAGAVVAAHRDKLPPEGREALDLIDEDVKSLQQLVDELLEVSELDSGRAVMRPETVAIRTFVETLLRRRRVVAPIAGDAGPIVTDKARLSRIVGNLVDNAFTHGEGRNVRVELRDGRDAVEIVVSDDGPGVDPESSAQLFERFYKRDRSRTRGRGGVGLGLAIARENAQLLGGTLTFSRLRNGGASFTLRLPRNRHGGEG